MPFPILTRVAESLHDEVTMLHVFVSTIQIVKMEMNLNHLEVKYRRMHSDIPSKMPPLRSKPGPSKTPSLSRSAPK